MSKWRKPLKNKKRFDARYFLDERDENALNEVLDPKIRLKRKRDAEDLMAHMSYEKSKQAHNFSFDSWLTESEQAVDESNCGSNKRDDEEELEEAAKPDFLDLDKDGDKEESMKKAAEEAEELDELQVMAHAVEKPMSSAVSPIKDEKPPVKKKKAKKQGPVTEDPPIGLEEDLEEA